MNDYDPLEPKVKCADVARLLTPHITGDEAREVYLLNAGVSRRTLWRVLSCDREWISLKKADDLLTACRETINDCRLKMPDGTIEEPWNGE